MNDNYDLDESGSEFCATWIEPETEIINTDDL